MIDSPNAHSTCEWIDEAYSRRLWGQMVKRADHTGKLIGTFWTARKRALDSYRLPNKNQCAVFVLPGPASMLDIVAIVYSRDGHWINERIIFRVSGHAGQRLFQRLRTNSDVDLLHTLEEAFVALISTDFASDAVELAWGTLHGVVDDGIWTAKTFVPKKPE